MINFNSYTKTALSVLTLSLLSVNGVLAQSKPVSVTDLAQSTTTETPVMSPTPTQTPQMRMSPTPTQTPEVQRQKPEITINPPLTPQQEKKLKSINKKYDNRIKSAENNYVKSLKNLQKIFGTNPSNDKIRDRYNKAQKAKQELNDVLLERSLEFRSVLTREQRESMAQSIRQLVDNK